MGQRDEDQFFDQRALERVRGALNQLRTVVKGHDLHAFRQPGSQRVEFLFDRVDYFQCVHAIARDHDPANRFLTVLVQRAGAKRVAEFYVGDVLDVNRSAVRRAQNDVLDIGNGLNQTDATHDRPVT